MQKFIIDEFLIDNPGQPFPWHEEVSRSEADLVRQKLCIKLGLPETLDGAPLVLALEQFATEVPGVNTHSTNFDLDIIIAKIGLVPPRIIYINWYQFDRIDKMKFDDFARHMFDLWGSGVDDFDIFPADLRWVMTLDHEGYIHLIRN